MTPTTRSVITHGLSFTTSDWKWTASLLIAGLVVFLVGAAGWKPAEFDVSAAEGLRNMSAYRGRIQWVVAWMTCGMVLTTYGLASLRVLLERDQGAISSWWFLLPFTVACVAMVAALFLLRTLVLRTPIDPTVEIPTTVLAWRTASGVLFVIHAVLGYATWVGLGVVARSTDLLPNGLGWAGIVLGTGFALGFILMRGGPFAPPFILHVFTAATGITMLLRQPPS
jgi:hypothetical protein